MRLSVEGRVEVAGCGPDKSMRRLGDASSSKRDYLWADAKVVRLLANICSNHEEGQ